MLRFISLLSLPMVLSAAGLPPLAGVWKADLQKSTFQGPPPSNYLILFEQNGNEITETDLVATPHGDRRSKTKFPIASEPTVTYFHGVPTRITTVLNGNALDLKAETAGRSDVTKQNFSLSADGSVLTITSDMSAEGHQMHSILVLNKQPDSASAPLREPEKTAGDNFKNVKSELKTLPASQFIDTMRYFSWALGKDCEFCHVRGKFDSDEKDEKKTARAMIQLVHDTNAQFFKGEPEVKCYTCHQFHTHPLPRALVSGETVEQLEKQMEHAHEAEPKSGK
ncbi:MAG: photosynthetic reaction center cytochrome c subunit [Acidobacteriaceae bacterium]|nr:photosynthetic reaction center cytochrome c subunit [Acidobacteriaceae bacterium]